MLAVMATLVYWAPAADALALDYYDVYAAASTTATFVFLERVAPQKNGPHWDATRQQFVTTDPSGTDATVYRVQGSYQGGLVFDTGIFQPQISQAAQLAKKIRLDHNYQAANNYQYVTRSGQGIPQARIRVFPKPEWEAGRRNVALFATETDNQGGWVSPFWLDPGMTYIVVFDKAGSYGPDIVEVAM